MAKNIDSTHKRAPKHREKGARKNSAPERLWLYGRHAVAAAIANPERRIRRIVTTKNAADWLNDRVDAASTVHAVEDLKPDAIDALLPKGAVHQGLAAEVYDLPRARLRDVCAPPSPDAPVIVLDQITDPQNIGALFRSGAAFNARCVIIQERRTPPLSGALAKAAAGAIEHVPCVKVVNIARALEALNDLGYQTVGLAGAADANLPDLDTTRPTALVLGAEGAGLRPLVAQNCEALARIPMAEQMESLNVSAAGAIALYAVSQHSRTNTEGD